MKKKYLVIAGIVTIMEAMLFGCGANPLAGSGEDPVAGGSMQNYVEDETTRQEGTQGADESLGSIDVADNGTEGSGECGNGAGDESEVCGYPRAEYFDTQTPPRMVMLNGRLYVETGETNSMPRCGVMDGAITATTDGEVPDQDGQSNFGKDIGYQYGMRENRIEIFLDDAWRIFAYNENNLDGVVMGVSDVTKTGCTVTIRNSREEELTFGEDFSLEMLDAETKEWTYVSIVVEGEWAFNLVGYPVSGQDTRDWEVDWSWLYGELAPGQYRIVKKALADIPWGSHPEGLGSYVPYYLMCEFQVN